VLRFKKKKKKPIKILIYSSANVVFRNPVSSAALGWKEGGGGVGAGQQTGSEDEIFKVTWEIGMLGSH